MYQSAVILPAIFEHTEYIYIDWMANTILRLCEVAEEIGYLAQHDFFAQIPALRNDFSIPDYCYASIPSPPTTGQSIRNGVSNNDADDNETSSRISINAWFGPANTISPLHTDPHHNILTQIIGDKFIRLYSPTQTPNLYPRGKEDGDLGIDMSNTSQVDIGVGMRVAEDNGFETVTEEQRKDFEERFPKFKDAEFVEGVLRPGECLFIPKGWWHYVRSLSPSISVSFWWD